MVFRALAQHLVFLLSLYGYRMAATDPDITSSLQHVQRQKVGQPGQQEWAFLNYLSFCPHLFFKSGRKSFPKALQQMFSSVSWARTGSHDHSYAARETGKAILTCSFSTKEGGQREYLLGIHIMKIIIIIISFSFSSRICFWTWLSNISAHRKQRKPDSHCHLSPCQVTSQKAHSPNCSEEA